MSKECKCITKTKNFIAFSLRDALKEIVDAKNKADNDSEWQKNEEEHNKKINEAFKYGEELLKITKDLAPQNEKDRV